MNCELEKRIGAALSVVGAVMWFRVGVRVVSLLLR